MSAMVICRYRLARRLSPSYSILACPSLPPRGLHVFCFDRRLVEAKGADNLATSLTTLSQARLIDARLSRNVCENLRKSSRTTNNARGYLPRALSLFGPTFSQRINARTKPRRIIPPPNGTQASSWIVLLGINKSNPHNSAQLSPSPQDRGCT